MNRLAIIDRYFEVLRNQDIDTMISLFDEKGVVLSPIFGESDPDVLFLILFTLSRWTKAEIKQINQESEDSFKADFHYQATPLMGRVIDFECTDYFQFAPGSEKILSLKPVFDSSKVKVPARAMLKQVFTWMAKLRRRSG